MRRPRRAARTIAPPCRGFMFTKGLSMSAIESVLHESRQFAPPEALAKAATISGMPAYRALVAEAERDYEGFWARLARDALSWHTPFPRVL
ncbi:acetyl-coenzyme A synthetase N-terminal domain-containing protein, partial [Burkholderia dolosa]|uniref:acetyl-coenzyme A synthetase N-terminal domain-containing protein n=1 Tax=Burkholderia dolosa TaxID=152500 RepID=UPI0028F3E5FA